MLNCNCACCLKHRMKTDTLLGYLSIPPKPIKLKTLYEILNSSSVLRSIYPDLKVDVIIRNGTRFDVYCLEKEEGK